MKIVMAVSAVLVFSMILAGCTDSADGPNSALTGPDPLATGDEISIPEVTFNECATNLATLCSSQSMYYGMYNCYASDVGDLYLLLGDTLTCPWTEEWYEVTFGGPDSFWIQCPNYPVHPGGGPGYSGPGYVNPLLHCRSQMRSIATMEALYYGQFDRYGTMLEMLEAGLGPYMVCPGCGYDYLIELGFETYSLTCPMPLYPSHGSIVDGIPSWE